MWRQWLPLSAVVLSMSACNPYYRFKGDSAAGAVDPAKFLSAYRGVDPNTGGPGNPNTPGSAVLTPAVAIATDGSQTSYFNFPYTGDPSNLTLTSDGELTVPIAYDFDEDKTTACTPPKDYIYDQQRDEVRYDQQGNIFIALPDNSDYVPVVADVAVHSQPGYECQTDKEEDYVVKDKKVAFTLPLTPSTTPTEPGAHPSGTPTDGVFYARPIIDPSINVTYADGSTDASTGLGPQNWGWYGRYLLAWLDGGKIPVTASTVQPQSGPAQKVVTMTAQVIYFPTAHPTVDQDGNTVTGPGSLGEGYDLIVAQRDAAGFSPLCQVMSFVPADPMNPETKIADIDMTTVTDTGTFIWCIQTPQQVAK